MCFKIRFVRQGPAKRRPSPTDTGSGSDGWGAGGVVFASEFEGNDEDELVQFLQANGSFTLTMTKTAGLTDPTMFSFSICLNVRCTFCMLNRFFAVTVFLASLSMGSVRMSLA